MVRLSLELIEPVKEGKVGRSGRAIILAKLVETNSYKIQWKKNKKKSELKSESYEWKADDETLLKS